MSYISGNTFFIQNAVNCSISGTINGQPIFIDCSKNCGQVCNAIFSGAAVCNDGQAFGCTIFCNASNYGYVCGTGILRGSSVLYGGADCVIQCDQSTIDAGAEVTDYEFLVTTTRPVNNYSLDGCYYIYSSGVSTLATGGWSNGYYDSGSLTNNFFSDVYPIAFQTQDSGLWYHIPDLNNYNSFLTDGFYKNGAFLNGVFNTSYSNPNIITICKSLQDSQCPNRYELFVDGCPCGNLNGFYYIEAQGVNNTTNALFLQNNCQSDPSAFGCFIFKVQNSELLGDCSELYGYYSSDNGQVSTLDGFYTSGYFPSCCSYGVIYYANPYANIASCPTLTKKDTTFSSLTPIAAQLTCSYYIYDNGNVTIATGLYSNYAIVNGDIDATYSTNMPNAAIDCGCQIYESGAALCVTDVNFVLDNGCYYGSLDNFQYQTTNCGEPIAYKSNLCHFSLIGCDRTKCDVTYYLCNSIFAYGNCSFSVCCLLDNFCFVKDDRNESTPLNTLISDKYFIYCNGSGIVPNGLYSNYAFDNSVLVNTTYACTLPQISLDNCCYYVYSSGVAAGATGAYSNYYFEPAASVATTCSITTPTAAQDNCIFYTYCDGSPAIVTGCRNDVPGWNASPTGIYNFGDNGEYNPVPCFAATANGPYTYTYFENGVPNSRLGIVRFDNQLILNEQDMAYGYRSAWIYHCTLSCCGIDPCSIGFSAGYNSSHLALACTSSNTSYGSSYGCSCCCSNALCCNSLVSIDGVFHYDLAACTYLDGCIFIYCNVNGYYACEDLYCDLYCDVYDENNVCCGQVCYGTSCYGSQVVTDTRNYDSIYLCVQGGSLSCFICNIVCLSFDNEIGNQSYYCDAAYASGWVSAICPYFTYVLCLS
jgi:hypothetical protein